MIRRVRAAGLEIWFAPAAVARHQMPASRTTFRYAARHAFDSARSRVIERAGQRGAAGYLLSRFLANLVKAPGFAAAAAALAALLFRSGQAKKALVRAWRSGAAASPPDPALAARKTVMSAPCCPSSPLRRDSSPATRRLPTPPRRLGSVRGRAAEIIVGPNETTDDMPVVARASAPGSRRCPGRVSAIRRTPSSPSPPSRGCSASTPTRRVSPRALQQGPCRLPRAAGSRSVRGRAVSAAGLVHRPLDPAWRLVSGLQPAADPPRPGPLGRRRLCP